ncbi:uncharacterized protein EKO05_0005628 [Ascochyta rabiei]|nr:uncharacterized protein EKO05_0005628 [Ascochyta rabiei]UPX15171.1 hypothetical protein EKO05_0005628 [Ascochyta rabiei]
MLSSILLASSNYTMQVLSSPTRREIDRAHYRGDWLEVGILSTRNLPKISRKRAVLCITLALSSIPLHLFYNAATFKVIASNDYHVFAIDKQSNEYQDKLRNNGTYTFMENGTWRLAYADQFMSGHSDLYLVIDQVVINTTRTTTLKMQDYLPWTTEGNFRDIAANMTNPDWVPYYVGSGPLQAKNSNLTAPESMHIISAFAKQTGSQSRLQISAQYMIVVIVFNTLKLCIMISVLIGIRSKHIVTLGDASASFLEQPDPITEGSFLRDNRGNNSYQIKVKLPRVKSPLSDSATPFYTQTATFAPNISYSDLIRTDKKVIFFIS